MIQATLPSIVDIRFEDQLEAAVDKTIATFGRIDILVNFSISTMQEFELIEM